MAATPLTPEQLGAWHQDRRPALYGTLITLCVINNVVAAARFLSHWRAYYRYTFGFKTVFAEDYFFLMSTLCINAVVGNLLASTHYGLGLHSWRINAEDPNYPRNISNAFKHVWVTMVLTGPTFTSIKLSLLFFYRRVFLVSQTWLKIAWWANVIYVMLWVFGATGFYLFQCWPITWYFMRYYQKYHVQPPYPIHGQCNATTPTHVAIPIIFGLFSDVMILVLPLATIFRLQLSSRVKIGLSLVFSVGAIACALDLVRIVELLVDTDDKIDPSYGVVVFLILTAATEVAAALCAALPIVGPQIMKEYKLRQASPSSRSKPSHYIHRSHQGQGFEQIEASHGESDGRNSVIALNPLNTLQGHPRRLNEGEIWVDSEVKITVGYAHNHEPTAGVP